MALKAEILLSGRNPHRLVALVDDEDLDRLSATRWYIHRPKASMALYAKTSTMFMHRVVMNAEKGQCVDHINGNGLDNRKENLRIVSHSENLRFGAERRSTERARALFDVYEPLL